MDINRNSTILNDYTIDMKQENGACSTDEVLYAFIRFIKTKDLNTNRLIGILGEILAPKSPLKRSLFLNLITKILNIFKCLLKYNSNTYKIIFFSFISFHECVSSVLIKHFYLLKFLNNLMYLLALFYFLKKNNF